MLELGPLEGGHSYLLERMPPHRFFIYSCFRMARSSFAGTSSDPRDADSRG
jgi:hypothetical protein